MQNEILVTKDMLADLVKVKKPRNLFTSETFSPEFEQEEESKIGLKG
jgi:hypothetical protein